MANSLSLYFAYGSNLLWRQMQARCPGARLHSVVRLAGYELCFPMISFTRGGMGVASIRLKEDAYVEGVVYAMTERDFSRLDHYESEGIKYRRVELEIPPIGPVWTYLPRLDAGHHYPPSEEYLNAVIQGATEHGLSSEYIQTLHAFRDRPEE